VGTEVPTIYTVTHALLRLYIGDGENMSIELELHLEGSDANEETLLDLLDWLGQEDISDLRVGRKELPPVEGKAGAEYDPCMITAIIINIPSAIYAIQQLFHSFRRWNRMRERDVVLKAKNVDDDELKNDETKKKIAALIEELHQKFEKNRHKK
jgi:hypothetical protein